MNLTELRSYRLDLENFPYYNNKSTGMALFDLTISFISAFILEYYFNLSKIIPVCKNKQMVYYLGIIPLGIIIHHIVAHLRSNVLFPEEITFLNKKIFTLKPNIYHLLLLILIIYIFNSC
jgi:uncharacterized protein YacL